MSGETYFERPGWFTTNVVNRLVAGLGHAGISVAGSRILEVPGPPPARPAAHR